MIGLMLAAQVLAAQPFAAPQKGQEYTDCLLSVAKSLEPSAESAAVIADAATTACRPAFSKASPNSSITIDQQIKLLDELRDAYRQALALHIVRQRACRHTTGCVLSTLPPPFGGSTP